MLFIVAFIFLTLACILALLFFKNNTVKLIFLATPPLLFFIIIIYAIYDISNNIDINKNDLIGVYIYEDSKNSNNTIAFIINQEFKYKTIDKKLFSTFGDSGEVKTNINLEGATFIHKDGSIYNEIFLFRDYFLIGHPICDPDHSECWLSFKKKN